MSFLDRNANNVKRLRRNAQRFRAGDIVGSIPVTAPITNTGTHLALHVATAGALITTSGLAVNVDGSSVTINGSNQLVATEPTLQQDTTKSIIVGGSFPFITLGVLVSAGVTSALGFSGTGGGLQVKVDGSSVTINGSNQLVATPTGSGAGLTSLPLTAADTSMTVGGSGLTVAVNKRANSGLQTAAGLGVLVADTSLTLAAGGVAVGLATNSGLQVSSGLLLKLTDTSLVLAVGGVSVNPAASGGLQTSSGLLVRGKRILASDPALTDGDTWYNSTSGSDKFVSKGLQASAVGLLYASATASNSVANTTAQTAFNQNVTLPSNFLTTGRVIRAVAYFTYSSATAATLQIAFALGTTVVAGPTLTATGTDSNVPFRLEVNAVVTVSGASGNVARFRYGIINNQAPTIGANATLAIDTTASLVAQFVAIWSVANVGNTVQMQYITIETLG